MRPLNCLTGAVMAIAFVIFSSYAVESGTASCLCECLMSPLCRSAANGVCGEDVQGRYGIVDSLAMVLRVMMEKALEVITIIFPVVSNYNNRFSSNPILRLKRMSMIYDPFFSSWFRLCRSVPFSIPAFRSSSVYRPGEIRWENNKVLIQI